MDPQKQIEELEAKVRALAEQLRRQQGSHGGQEVRQRRVGRDAPRGGVWLSRALLVFMTLAVAWALLLTFRAMWLGVDQALPLNWRLAQLDTHYGLLAVALLALVGAVLYFAGRRILFALSAALTFYVVFACWAAKEPAGLDVPHSVFFPACLGVLTLGYLLVSASLIAENHHRPRYGIAWVALANSLAYFALLHVLLERNHPELAPVSWFLVALGLGVLAVFSETLGPYKNHLFQLFVVKTVVVSTAALKLVSSPEKLAVVLAFECLALALMHVWTKAVTLKALDMILLAVAAAAAFLSLDSTAVLGYRGVTVAANWFSAVGAATVLLVVAWVHEQYVRPLKPHERTVSGHWFWAGTAADVRTVTSATAHGAAAAFILLAATISDRGDALTLPYLLAVESAAVMALGIVMGARCIETSSVVLLAGAQTGYFFFLAADQWAGQAPGFQAQPSFVPFTLLLVLYALVAAFRWERHVGRPAGWDSRTDGIAVSLPYLPATLMLATLIGNRVEGVSGPLAENVLGILLLVIAAAFGLRSLYAAGILALGVGAVTFWVRLHHAAPALTQTPFFWVYFGFLLLTYVAAERLPAYLKGPGSRAERWTRTVLVLTAAALCAAALRRGAPAEYFAPLLLGEAFVAGILAVIFSENRYGLAGLAAVAGAGAYAGSSGAIAAGTIRGIPTTVVGLAVLLFLAASWAYRLRRAGQSKQLRRARAREGASDG